MIRIIDKRVPVGDSCRDSLQLRLASGSVTFKIMTDTTGCVYCYKKDILLNTPTLVLGSIFGGIDVP